jgi:pilus assembly protein CpaF
VGQVAFGRLVDRVRDRLAGAPAGGELDDRMGDEAGRPRLAQVADAVGRDQPWRGPPGTSAAGRVHASLVGLGPLAPLLADPAVTDVCVNGPGSVWVDRGVGAMRRVPVDVGDAATIRDLAVRLARLGRRRLDDSVPIVDARLPGGLRLHAVLPPVGLGGPYLSLRVPAIRRLSLADLVAAGSLGRQGAALLTALVRARKSLLISGGAGAGKTTLLGALLDSVDTGERVVLVEDVAEVRCGAPNLVRLEARPSGADGIRGVDLAELVRAAVRMRPDRLVVGECRGGDVVDLLAAMNTGQDGALGTIHANTAADIPARVEALAASAGIPAAAARTQLRTGVAAVVHLRRDPDGSRRVSEVGCCVGGGSGGVRVVSAYRNLWSDIASPGPAAERIADLVGAECRRPQLRLAPETPGHPGGWLPCLPGRGTMAVSGG